MPENRQKSGRKRNQTSFKKGQSGNPAGRPKRTPEQVDALEAIKALAPTAVEQLNIIINDAETPAAARIKAIQIILERTYGKADMSVKVETSKVSHIDDLKEELKRLKGDPVD